MPAEIGNTDTDNYYIIKGRFKGTNSNTYGLFIMFISIPTKTLENVLVAASHFSTIYEYSPDMDWASFEEKITNLKWKGEVSTNISHDLQIISHDLQILMANTIKQDLVEEFIESIDSNQLGKIEHTIVNIISKGLIDKSVIIDFKINRVSHQEIIKTKDERARREKEEREAKKREEMRKAEAERFKVEEGGVILDASLVLAPVSGIPISEAKQGDQIMIKIDSSTERGNYFIDLLNARSDDGNVRPVKGVIKDVFMNALGEYQILAEIGPGIYARAIETEQVKIKRYDPSEEPISLTNARSASDAAATTAVQGATIKPTEISKPKDYFIWIVGAITFILALLIFYLLISGIL